MAGYVRNDTINNIADGNIINAADLDGEFDKLQTAFGAASGHNHSGSAGDGKPIESVGPAQDFVVSATAATPKTNNTLDVGATSFKFKDGFFAGKVDTGTITLGGTNVTSSAAELNLLDGVTATTAELNKLAGATVSTTELNYVTGVTSAIQTQLGTKQATITGAATTVVSSNLTANFAMVSDASGKVAVHSTVTSTELGYLDGVTSAIQTQIGTKQATLTGAATTIASSDLTASRALASNASGKVVVSTVTDTELGYVSGVTSAIQTQLNAKAALAGPAFTGQASFADGTAAAPSIAHTGDLNAGLFFPAADTVAVSTAGVERLRVDSSGNVGIGTASPTQKLMVEAATGGTTARFRNTTAGNFIDFYETAGATRQGYVGVVSTDNFALWNDKAGYTVFGTNATERMRIDTSGNVGIGTTSPVSRLTVGGISVTENGSTSYGSSLIRGVNYSLSDTQRGILDIEMSAVSAIDNGATLTFTNNFSQFVQGYDYVGVGIKAGKETSSNLNESTYLAISTNNNISLAERMRITSGGNVGIGNNNPTARLEVVTTSGTATAKIWSATNTTPIADLELQRGTNATWGADVYGDYRLRNDSGALLFQYGESTVTTERMRIDASGNVGIGTNSPTSLGTGITTLELKGNSASQTDRAGGINFMRYDGNPGMYVYHADDASYISSLSTYPLLIQTNGSERMRITSAGNISAGTSSTNISFDIGGGINLPAATTESRTIELGTGRTGNGYAYIDLIGDATYTDFGLRIIRGNTGPDSSGLITHRGIGNFTIQTQEAAPITFATNNAEAMRILATGNVGIGTVSPTTKLSIEGALNFSAAVAAPAVSASIYSPSASQLAFGTASTERMRIDASGNVSISTSSSPNTLVSTTTIVGIGFSEAGYGVFVRDSSTPLYVNRLTNDGALVELRQAGVSEGNISVSGTTVSYNGGHLSRWAQLPDGSRPELLKGTVMSNLDQMSNWDGEENEQLNCVEISTVEGDANVAGLFVAWDSTEDDYNDILLAMTGDMVIRIAAGVTVARGDLLMAAGDGTAKPQADDIIRAKTIAKVTSNHVSHTYADGSYAVPCVVMAC